MVDKAGDMSSGHMKKMLIQIEIIIVLMLTVMIILVADCTKWVYCRWR